MKITKNEKNAINSIIKDYLSSASASTRKTIITETLKIYKEQVNETGEPNPAINSYIGIAFQNLVKTGEIVKQHKKYSLKSKVTKTNNQVPQTIDASKCEFKIIELLQIKSYKKQELYNELQKEFATKNNKSLNSKLKTIAGQLLSKLKDNETIILKDKKYSYNVSHTENVKLILTQDACEIKIIELVKEKKYSKTELFKAMQLHFNTKEDKTKKLDASLKRMINQILVKLTKSKVISLKNKKYSYNEQALNKEYSNTPLPINQFEKEFLSRLVECGGIYFEQFVANLLEKYFLIAGRDVLDCKVIGGTKDGGIDITIEVMDEFGFKDYLMIQAKCRKSNQVTEKELREFIGALYAKNGTRGIYITTSTFHSHAKQFLSTMNNCVGIDGHKLFDIAKRTAYGIKKNKDGYFFDETIFPKQS